MRILQKNTLLVFMHYLDADQATLPNEAVLGTVAMPGGNDHTLTIPSIDNQVYFKHGTKLLHAIDGNCQHQWFLVKKSDVLAEDTKHFKHHIIKEKY